MNSCSSYVSVSVGQCAYGGLELVDPRGQVGHGSSNFQLILPGQAYVTTFLNKFNNAHRIDRWFWFKLQLRGFGMRIDLDLVPLREEGMSAYEIMLSESQERMLVVIEKG